MKKALILLPLILLSCTPTYPLESVNQFYKTKNKLESTEGFQCSINSKIVLDATTYIITRRGSNQGNDRIRVVLINNTEMQIADIDPDGVYLNIRALKNFEKAEINLIISNNLTLLKFLKKFV
jgi:hypothetical protein